MRNFKEKTVGGAVIMGRKTLESLPGGKTLEDRVNIVMSKNPANVDAEFHCKASGGRARPLVCSNLDELALCLKRLKLPNGNIWVVGGAEILRLLSPYCEEAHVTRVLAAVSDADARAEDMDRLKGWKLTERGAVRKWEGLRFRFDRYKNISVKQLC